MSSKTKSVLPAYINIKIYYKAHHFYVRGRQKNWLTIHILWSILHININ